MTMLTTERLQFEGDEILDISTIVLKSSNQQDSDKPTKNML